MTQAVFMRTAETLIRLGGCPGWFESSLGAHSFCWFCHVAAQITFYKTMKYEQWSVKYELWTLKCRFPMFSIHKITFCHHRSFVVLTHDLKWYSQLATCICLSWIFTIFDWSMHILTDRWRQINRLPVYLRKVERWKSDLYQILSSFDLCMGARTLFPDKTKLM